MVSSASQVPPIVLLIAKGRNNNKKAEAKIKNANSVGLFILFFFFKV